MMLSELELKVISVILDECMNKLDYDTVTVNLESVDLDELKQKIENMLTRRSE